MKKNEGIINFFSEINVKRICKKYGIENWSLNSDGTVDVDGNVDLSNCALSKLPLNFGRVSGDFLCGRNYLTNLRVDSDFYCHDNKITSLLGSPIEINGNFP